MSDAPPGAALTRRRGSVPARALLAIVLAAAMLAVASRRARAGTSQSACRPAAQLYVLVRAVDAPTAHNAITAAGGRVDRDIPALATSAGWVLASSINAVQTTAGVLSVTPDTGVSFQGVAGTTGTTGPAAASGVFPQVVGATSLWAQGLTGARVGVAVIDTGIAPVPALAGRLVGGVDLTGANDPYRDGYGHGTFVAGLIGGSPSADGTLSGLAPQVNLISVKVGGDDGTADVSQILAAIQWVVSFKDRLGIRVVNLSLGTDSTQPAAHSLLDYAVERAWDAGLVVVTSASNLGPAPGTITKPGDDPLVITVGAVADQGTPRRADDTMASFSGAGPTADGLAKPDLVAPGRSVISLRAPGSQIDTDNPGSRIGDAYFKGSGTSFATAITSGAIALLLQAQPALSPDQVKGRLLLNAAKGPVGDPNVDGRGALDIAAATVSGPVPFSQTSVPRSDGDGSLSADRGHVGTQVGVVTSAGGCASLNVPAALTGETTAQNRPFNRGDFTGAAWTSSSWYSSSWYSSSWYSSSWYSSSWYSSSWYSSSWYSSSWYAATWS